MLKTIVVDIKTLPDNMLLIIPSIDILLVEQLTFVERVKADIEAEGMIVGQGGWKGWSLGAAFMGGLGAGRHD